MTSAAIQKYLCCTKTHAKAGACSIDPSAPPCIKMNTKILPEPPVSGALFALENDVELDEHSTVFSHPIVQLVGQYLLGWEANNTTLPLHSAPVLAWHPTDRFLAVAGRYEVHLHRRSSGHWCKGLGHEFQIVILCMQWSTAADGMLAVGTSNGVVLWDHLCDEGEDEISAWASFLQHPKRLPVTDVQFCPQGRFIAAASARDAAIYLWDVGTKH